MSRILKIIGLELVIVLLAITPYACTTSYSFTGASIAPEVQNSVY